LFDGESTEDMARAIDRAMSLRGYPAIWRAMQTNGMRTDFSWAKTAPDYLAAYQSLCPDLALQRVPDRPVERASERIPERRRASSGFAGQVGRTSPGVLATRGCLASGTADTLNRIRDGVALEPAGPRRASAA